MYFIFISLKVWKLEINVYICIMLKQPIRPLHVIASEIRKDWKKVYFGAVPYLDALSTLDKITDNFYDDTAKSIVLYFLSNASSWKGDKAREIKKELNNMAK